jgi:nitrate reductase assembly molybdenum cofactor insertion protein NarJ
MSGVQSPVNPEVAGLLSEAARWRLLGLLFEYPSGRWRGELEALLSDLQDETERGLAASALEFSSEGLHSALFGPGGNVPAREVAYLGGVQFGYLMAELAAFYEAFGYQPSPEEAHDHISVEAGFVGYLKLKQAYAAVSGDAEHAAVAAQAAATFMKEHVAMFAEPMLPRLENFAPDYLAGAGKMLLELAGPSPRSGYPLSDIIDDEIDSSEMSCGSPDGAAEIIQLEPMR